MSRGLKSTDLGAWPEVARLVEEIQATRQPRVLTRDGVEVAVLTPVRTPRKRRTRTEADFRAFQAAAGAWRGLVDVDRFVEENYQTRSRSNRPPVAL